MFTGGKAPVANQCREASRTLSERAAGELALVCNHDASLVKDLADASYFGTEKGMRTGALDPLFLHTNLALAVRCLPTELCVKAHLSCGHERICRRLKVCHSCAQGSPPRGTPSIYALRYFCG